MRNLTRRDVLRTVPAAALLRASNGFAVPITQRVFVASNTPEGIRAFDWNPATAELTSAGVAAEVDNNVDWLCFSPDRKTIFAAAELDTFRGKPTGAVASLRLNSGKLTQISAENSAAKGTCQCAIDRTGQTLLAADYGGGSAASFKVTDGASARRSGPSTTPSTVPTPTARKPPTPTSLPSRRTTASPSSTTSAATASTSTACTRPPRSSPTRASGAPSPALARARSTSIPTASSLIA